MLTAKDGDLDEAEALDTGADDYLAKPFSFPVLVARIRALLRRTPGRDLAPLVVGDLRIDPGGAARAGAATIEIALTTREFDVLEFLVRRAGHGARRRPRSSPASGTTTSTATPTSSRCTSAGCAARSTSRSAHDDRDRARRRLPARGRLTMLRTVRGPGHRARRRRSSWSCSCMTAIVLLGVATPLAHRPPRRDALPSCQRARDAESRADSARLGRSLRPATRTRSPRSRRVTAGSSPRPANVAGSARRAGARRRGRSDTTRSTFCPDESRIAGRWSHATDDLSSSRAAPLDDVDESVDRPAARAGPRHPAWSQSCSRPATGGWSAARCGPSNRSAREVADISVTQPATAGARAGVGRRDRPTGARR